jgi:uncharacterized protein YcgI (DUF1989 family)
MPSNIRIEPRTGVALELAKGQRIRVEDLEGGQVADLTACALTDQNEWLANGQTFDYNASLRMGPGTMLYSNRSRPMLEIVEDTAGTHNFLYAACSPEMFARQYPERTPRPNCQENLLAAFAERGINPPFLPTPFNVFMNVNLQPNGDLQVLPARSRKGDAIVLRAQTDLVIGLAACSAPGCNGGSFGPIGVEVS